MRCRMMGIKGMAMEAGTGVPHRFLMVGAFAPSLVKFRGPLLESLVANGWEVHAAANAIEEDCETEAGLESLAVSPHSLPIQRAGLNVFSDIRTLVSMVALFHSIKPHAMLVYTIKPVVWGLIAGWIARVPRRYAMVTGLGYAFTGKASGKRLLIQGIARQLYRIALSHAHGIFFQNPDDATLFDELGLLPKDVPVTIVDGSGVDLRVYRQEPLPDLPMSFLLIARLLGDKGIREYAAAAAEVRKSHPEVQFHLVGGIDPNPNAIGEDELASWQENGTIIWHGEQADVRPFLANCHVYVLPSYREGTPRTVLEAMATGRPVITTDAPGCRETVVPNVNGLLVPPGQVAPLAYAMRTLIENPAKVRLMADAALSIVEKRYAADKVASTMLAAMGA